VQKFDLGQNELIGSLW